MRDRIRTFGPFFLGLTGSGFAELSAFPVWLVFLTPTWGPVFLGLLGFALHFQARHVYQSLKSSMIALFKASHNHQRLNRRLYEGTIVSLALWSLGVMSFAKTPIPSSITIGIEIWTISRCIITFREVLFLVRANRCDIAISCHRSSGN